MNTVTESLLREEYLFESDIQDIHRRGHTGLHFEVRPRERPGVCHFHIYNIKNASKEEKRSKKYFECCLVTSDIAYWNHEPFHRKIPNKKMLDAIVTFLKSSPPEAKGYTVWGYMRYKWLQRYPTGDGSKKLEKITEMPDYSKLPTFN